MSELSTHNHGNNLYSIKDLGNNGEVNLSEAKWNVFFDPLIANSQSVYFEAMHRNYDDEFEDIVDHLAEEIFKINRPGEYILMRIKLSNLIVSRKQIEKAWHY